MVEVAVHRRRRHLRLLRAAAVPARALRRPGRLPDRRPGGGDRRRRADRSAASRRRGSAGCFHRRTSALIVTAALSTVSLALIGLVESFWAVIGLIVVWGLLFAASMPIRQAYLNGLIPSRQRATILSFDSMTVLRRRRLGPAGARPRRRRLGLRALLPDRRGHLGPGAPVPRAVAAPERPRRHARGHGRRARPPAWLRPYVAFSPRRRNTGREPVPARSTPHAAPPASSLHLDAVAWRPRR